MKNKPTPQRTLSRVRHETARCLVLLAFLLPPSAFILPTAAADAPSPTGPLTYDNFKLVHTRNVFDPDRRPVRPANATPTGGRADYVALTGTMINTDKSYAFFSGSRSDFNRVLSVGDKIANARLTEITPLNIVVERDGRRINVAVGQTVPLDAKSVPGAPPVNVVDTAAPNPGSVDAVAPTASNNPAAAPANSNNNAAPGTKPPVGNREEIMRKMMERRQQDLK